LFPQLNQKYYLKFKVLFPINGLGNIQSSIKIRLWSWISQSMLNVNLFAHLTKFLNFLVSFMLCASIVLFSKREKVAFHQIQQNLFNIQSVKKIQKILKLGNFIRLR